MAKHYETTVIAARPYKPRDKGADENAVQNVSRRIIASLRNIQFFGFGIKDVTMRSGSSLKNWPTAPSRRCRCGKQALRI